MDGQNISKPVWLWIYFVISLIFVIFGIYAVSVDISGFAIIVAGPIIIIGILLSSIAYGVYYWKRTNKKFIGNLVLWPLFVISLGFVIFGILQLIAWYSKLGLRNLPFLIFIFVIVLLLSFLLIILNRQQKTN